MRGFGLISIAAFVVAGCGWPNSGRKSDVIRPQEEVASAASPRESTAHEPVGEVAAQPPAAQPPAAATRPSPYRQVGQPDVVAATMLQVDDKFITLKQVLHPIRRELRAAAAGSSLASFRQNALALVRNEIRRKIEQTVLVAEAEKELTDEEERAVQGEVDRRLRQRIAEAGSKTRFAEQLASEGTDLSTWKQDLRGVLVVSACLQRRFGERIKVSRRMMWEYYNSHRDEFRSKQSVQMQIIAAPFNKFLPADRAASQADQQAARAKARAQAEEALAALKKGEDFAQAAKRLSKGPMASSGGVWPMMERGSFRAVEVEQAAFDQKVGQVSGLIETPAGFYVVKTLARKAGSERSFETVQAGIEDKLRRQQYDKLKNEYLRTLEAQTTIRTAGRFEEVAVDAAVRTFFPRP